MRVLPGTLHVDAGELVQHGIPPGSAFAHIAGRSANAVTGHELTLTKCGKGLRIRRRSERMQPNALCAEKAREREVGFAADI